MTPEDQRPLRPLAYTVQPDQTRELIEARERRLLSELGGEPRSQKNKTEKTRPTTSDALGQRVFDTLVARDEVAFRDLWPEPEAIAFENGISLTAAQDLLDGFRGESTDVWAQFDPGTTSEKNPNGLGDVIRFVEFKLGPQQNKTFVDNTFTVVVTGTELTFSFPVERVLIGSDNSLGLASAIMPDPQLDFFRSLGMHLRPGVLAPDTYWFPLNVGNFWRYRLTTREITRDFGAFERGLEDADGATTKTVQVETVERLGVHRLVTLRNTYDDADETTVIETWLLFPNAIYLCDVNCVATASEPEHLLLHLDGQTPLFKKPLTIGASWGDFKVSAVNDVTVPMGRFDGVLQINAGALSGMFDPSLMFPQIVWFKPSVGIVKRRVERTQRPFEVLIEYRLMP